MKAAHAGCRWAGFAGVGQTGPAGGMLELESRRRSAAADGFAPHVAQGAQFSPVGMAHGAGAALAFRPEMPAIAPEDILHEGRRHQRHAVGEVPHPAPQHLVHRQASAAGQDFLNLFRREALADRLSQRVKNPSGPIFFVLIFFIAPRLRSTRSIPNAAR